MAVEGAVQAGEKVVVDGVDRLRNGAKVEVIAPNFKGGPGGGGKWNGAKGEGKPGAEGKSSAASEPAAPGKTGAADKGVAEGSKPAQGIGAAASGAQHEAPAAGSANGANADSERRRAFFQSLSPEEREKIKAMSPEERQAWREKMRQQRGGAAN
jgi:multidrug efflux system membrane fusion protein